MSARQAVINSRFFSLDEWPDAGVLDRLDPRVITELDKLRRQFGFPIFPSRHPRGWARMDGSTTSRHFAGGDRLADAGDIFPSRNVMDCWALALAGPWGGIGVYLDTMHLPHQPGPMLHLDLRPTERRLWVRNQGRYVYLNSERAEFWRLIAQATRAPNA